MARQRTRLGLLLPGLVAVLAWAGPAAAGEPVRFHAPPPSGDSTVSLAADNAAEWAEGDWQFVRLGGRVLIRQGVIEVRAEQAVVVLDLAAWRKSRTYEPRVFAAGNVRLARGGEDEKADAAVVDFSSRSGIQVAAKGKLSRQAPPRDGVILWALREVLPRAAEAAVRPEAPPRPEAAPAAEVRPASLQKPAGSSGGWVAPASQSAAPRPAAPAIVPVQATAPAAPFPDTSGPPGSPGPPVDAPQPLPPPRPVPGAAAPAPSAPDAAAAPKIIVPPDETGPARVLRVAPRTGGQLQVKSFPLPSGEQATLITGGVLVTARGGPAGIIDLEADSVVFYTKQDGQGLFNSLRSSAGQPARDVEVYLAGNVVARTQTVTPQGPQVETLRAEQVYYDVSANRAVAVSADLELRSPIIVDPLHVKANELQKLDSHRYALLQAEIASSKLPSDPGLKLTFSEATLEQSTIQRRNIFGFTYRDADGTEADPYDLLWFRGKNSTVELGGVPVFYSPYLAGDARDPLGPLQNIGFSQNRIFGTQFYTTFNVYDLLALNPPPNRRWTADVDYLSERGPALGTRYDFTQRNVFGVQDSRETGHLLLWGLYDHGTDILGGNRPSEFNSPAYRGRGLYRDLLEFPDQGVTVWTQLSPISDKNFVEQFFKNEWDTTPNLETYIYPKWQSDTFAATLLAKPNIRPWITEDIWLPRADGYAQGLSPFDIFTYNAHAQAGYAQLRPTTEPPPALLSTEQNVRTGRFDLRQELSAPVTLGAVRVVPYGVLELTSYTDDLTGNSIGRVYGGGGARASIPFSRLYPGVSSEFFNLKGINHKIVVSGNYYAAHSNEPYFLFPEIDRLNDDATDQALRDITPQQPSLNPKYGLQLQNNPIFNPQLYAIRRLVDTNVDTLDSIQVFQADVRQRFQTKRGFPGAEHTVDYFVLDLSASFFPNPAADNFGQSVGFLEYDALWNVGDRTSLVAAGWFDPFQDGARYWVLGGNLNRDDRTNFFLNYRQTDPLNSKAVTGGLTYIFSPKYALTASASYDFGTQESLSNTIALTRIGTDLQVSLGLTYNSLVNNLNFNFIVVPNAVAARNPGLGSGRGMFNNSQIR